MSEFNQKDDLLFFAPERPDTTEFSSGFWNILIIDDEESVHEVTRFAMKGFVFEGRPIVFHSAYSAEEAVGLLRLRAQEFQVVLLDIVMEHRRSGLDVVRFLREELQNNFIQIVVRTGNPGMAPEDYVVHHYEINDYEEKNSLTVQRLKTSITAALRAHRNMEAVQQLVQVKLEEVNRLRQTIRQVTFATDAPKESKLLSGTLISLPVFLRHSQPYQSPEPESELPAVADIGVTMQFIQGKIATMSRKAIAIFDYSTFRYRYVSDNMEEVTGLDWHNLIHKLQQGGHYSPDMHKIDKINKALAKAYGEASTSEKARFTAVFDYRITPVAPQNVRMLEYITPLLFSEEGNLLLSLHIFSNINHLKKADANSILAIHKPERRQYFSISDYRMEEIFFGQREQEIILYSEKNLLSKEIAKQINLSVHTVDTHLRNLRDRLGVAGTNALISYCKEITHLFGN